MGRYYPPSTTDTPTFNSGANLRRTQRKLPDGAQTVRFEMPFHVWCETCPQPTIVPQGVRFNAEKRKVGMYYSTPIWAFRMKHTACGGAIEIRTDPARSEYVVSEGGKRRDYGEDKGDVIEGGEILTEEERERRRNDAFAALEGKIEDKARAAKEKDRLDELREASERGWSDPYEASRKLRKTFRVERKAREKAAGQREEIEKKFGLGLALLDETEADRARARVIDFGEKGIGAGEIAYQKPLFGSLDLKAKAKHKPSIQKMPSAERRAEESRSMLQNKLAANTRAAMDPFLVSTPQIAAHKTLLGLKRKRSVDPAPADEAIFGNAQENKETDGPHKPSLTITGTCSLGLVDYDSD